MRFSLVVVWKIFYIKIKRFFVLFRNSDGNWNVPCVLGDSSGFNRNGNRLDNDWNGNYRVVLLDTLSLFIRNNKMCYFVFFCHPYNILPTSSIFGAKEKKCLSSMPFSSKIAYSINLRQSFLVTAFSSINLRDSLEEN